MNPLKGTPMYTIRTALLTTASLALFSGCVHAVPSELGDARIAYSQASAGPAAELVPAELHIAKQSLAEAEQAFLDEPRSYHTLDLAYVAQRTAQRADALGRIAVEQQKSDRAKDEFIATQSAIMKTSRADLQASTAAGAETKAALAGSQAALAGSEAALAGSQAALAGSEEARHAALSLASIRALDEIIPWIESRR